MDMDNGKWQIQNSYFAPFLSTQGISRLNVRGTTTSSSKVAPKQEKIKYDEECWKRLDSNKAEHANNSPALTLFLVENQLWTKLYLLGKYLV